MGLSWARQRAGPHRYRVARPARVAARPSGIADADHGATTSVIVVEAADGGDQAEQLVVSSGGEVTAELGIIDAFAADMPSSAIDALRGTPGVISVTPDARVTLLGGEDPYLNDDSITARPELVLETMRAERYWNDGFTGAGVDVAVIDSGVVPVEGLSAPGKVINGADLSFESQSDDLRYMDTFGHGTHIPGIIAGRDSDAPPADQRDAKSNRYWYLGLAPDARIVNVKSPTQKATSMCRRPRPSSPDSLL